MGKLRHQKEQLDELRKDVDEIKHRHEKWKTIITFLLKLGAATILAITALAELKSLFGF